MLRSINVAFPPFIRAAFAFLVLFGFHRLVMVPLLMRATPGPPPPSKTATSEVSSPATLRAARPGLSRAMGGVGHWVRALGRWRPGSSGIRWFIGALLLAAINERLKVDGMRTIDLADAELVARYGLEALAKESGHFQQES